MSKFSPAGPIAAYVQRIMVVAITFVFLLAVWWNSALSGALSILNANEYPDDAMASHAIYLRFLNSFAAVSLVVVKRKYFEAFSEESRRKVKIANPITPRKELELIFSQLAIAAVVFGIATLQPPPTIVIATLKSFATEWITTAVWSGLLSTATAFFGANAVTVGSGIRFTSG